MTISVKKNNPIRNVVINQITQDLNKIYDSEFDIANVQGEEYLQERKRKYGFNMRHNDLKSMGYDSIDIANFCLDIEERTQKELGEGIDISKLLDDPEILGDLGDKTKKLTPFNIIKFIELKYKLTRV
ncbi:hypothetical protein GF378_01085 [Candidatus Pacearchaeota archaeon]|nr:hypothetical protein [Candidatus Pacearchaeota archaeon]